ncbi:metalloregulator ArsR/SmtB family transcription factor [Aminobacter sp. Piv2-1]|uniref:ArsR/SmtB family transcription factor n=1 Tax=Aminobacter sp. Piv2-1 TaxID=3031122 RepID=UPI0030A68A58
MTGPDIQNRIFAEIAELARAMGHGHRLMLLEHVAQGERSVERLAELAGLSLANASQHLQLLRRAGLVGTRRDGKRVLYRLADGPVAPLLAALRHLAEHNRADVRELVAGSRQAGVEAISREELLERMRENSVILLDVRPQEEFALGHLPGALNIPGRELERRLAELPAGQEIVAYCRGPYCVFSAEAVALLRANGFEARKLEAGFPDWKAAGLAVEAA